MMIQNQIVFKANLLLGTNSFLLDLKSERHASLTSDRAFHFTVELGCVKLGCVKLGCVKLGVKLGCVKLDCIKLDYEENSVIINALPVPRPKRWDFTS